MTYYATLNLSYENVGNRLQSRRSDMSYENDVQEPLEIDRAALVGVLQENLATEKAKRESENEKQKAAMDAFSAFLAEHPAEVTGFVAYYLGWESWGDALKKATEAFEESDRWTPKEIKPSRKENDLEKLVRVMGLASNATIKVTPDTDIYNLL